jgi:hypothetical protein
MFMSVFPRILSSPQVAEPGEGLARASQDSKSRCCDAHERTVLSFAFRLLFASFGE